MQFLTNNREHYFLLLGGVLIFAYYLFTIIEFSPRYHLGGYDRQVFRYMGMLLVNGGIPYTEAFDHKPPIIYFLNFFGHLITPSSDWGVFIVINIIGLLSSFFLFKAANKLTGFIFIPFILVLVYIIFIEYYLFPERGNLTRQVAAYLVTIFLSIINLFEKNKYVLLSLGGIFALVFLTQQNEVMALIPITGVYLLSGDSLFSKNIKKSIIKDTSYIGLGMSIVTFFTLFIFFSSISTAIEQFIFFNFKYVVLSYNLSFFEKIANLIYVLYTNSYHHYLLILILTSLLFSLKRINNRMHFALLIGLIIQFMSTSLSGNTSLHYFLMFIPWVVFLLIFTTLNTNNVSVAIILFVCLSILGLQTHSKWEKLKHIKPIQLDEPLFQITQKVSEKANTKGHLYVYSAGELWLNSYNNIISPTKWIYTHLSYQEAFDPNGEIITQIISDLKKYKTTFILIPPLKDKQEYGNNAKEYIRLKVLYQFLDRKYKLIIKRGNLNLFELKTEQAKNLDRK